MVGRLPPLTRPRPLRTNDIATGGQVAKVQLAYLAAVDLASGVAVVAATWTNLGPQHAFTVDDPTALVVVLVASTTDLGTTAALSNSTSRVLLNGVTSYVIGGTSQPAGAFGNPFAGGSPLVLAGLSPGTHTLQVQVRLDYAGTLWCAPASYPNLYFFRVGVLELKR